MPARANFSKVFSAATERVPVEGVTGTTP